MSVKMDRRQVRTKQLMRKALMELIEEKGMEGITVTDISNSANINRGTFYLHYRDVSDMLDQIKDEVFEDLRKLMVQVDFIELMSYAAKNETYPKAIRIFEAFSRNADFLKVICGPKGDPSYPLRFKELMKSHFFNKLAVNLPKERIPVPYEYLMDYISSAHLGVVLHWVETGMKESPEEIATIMTHLINHGPLNPTSWQK